MFDLFNISYLICFVVINFSIIPICVIFIFGQTKNCRLSLGSSGALSNMLCVAVRLTTNTMTELKPLVDRHCTRRRPQTQDDHTTINTILLRLSHRFSLTASLCRLVFKIVFYWVRCNLCLRRRGSPDNSHHYFI